MTPVYPGIDHPVGPVERCGYAYVVVQQTAVKDFDMGRRSPQGGPHMDYLNWLGTWRLPSNFSRQTVRPAAAIGYARAVVVREPSKSFSKA